MNLLYSSIASLGICYATFRKRLYFLLLLLQHLAITLFTVGRTPKLIVEEREESGKPNACERIHRTYLAE